MAPVMVGDGEGSVAASTAVKEEEAVDFGGDEPANEGAGRGQEKKRAAGGPLRRAMPDYGDLIDADGEVKEDVKGEDEVSGEKRPEALHISGIQRLTRTHLEEVFNSKGLPLFSRIDYITDDSCICVYSSAAAAATALRGADAGFGDTMADEERPGPGLWRAQRGMMDFRQATTTDKPDLGFTKRHRGGRQVREFRFWEAIKQADKEILQGEDEVNLPAQKRPRQEAVEDDEEDVKPVDEWSQWMSALGESAQKRQRREEPVEEPEDGFDLLAAMANQDKEILSKEPVPDKEEATRWPKGHGKEAKGSRGEAREAPRGRGGKGGDAWNRDDGQWQDSGSAGGGAWQHDDRGGDSRGGGGKSWSGGKGGEDQQKGGANKRRRDGGADRGKRDALGDAPALGEWGKLDDEERARRAKRGDRFNAVRRAEPAADAPAAEAPAAQTDEEKAKRLKRAERFNAVRRKEPEEATPAAPVVAKSEA